MGDLAVIKIAVVEDEIEMTNQLLKYVKQFFNENDLDYSVTTYNNAIKLLDNYDFSFDLIFMDINMPILDGMSASKKLREIDSEVTLIFITSLAQYAINGYEVNAFDFVLKPISYYNFALKLTRAIDKLSIEDAKTLIIIHIYLLHNHFRRLPDNINVFLPAPYRSDIG